MTRDAAGASPHSRPGFDYRAAEDRQTILAPGLRMSFLRAVDRWTHALSLAIHVGDLDEPPLVEIAATIESDPGRDDPARLVSPVYQDVQPHLSGGEIRALLTGQYTPHHFSAVVSARRDGPGVVVEVDVADRCRAPVEVLAATYLVQLGSSALIDADAGAITWGGEALGGGRLEFRGGSGAGVALAEAGRRASRVQALARLVPAAGLHTRRLVYSWRWIPRRS